MSKEGGEHWLAAFFLDLCGGSAARSVNAVIPVVAQRVREGTGNAPS
jgi:hypothetical protein